MRNKNKLKRNNTIDVKFKPFRWGTPICNVRIPLKSAHNYNLRFLFGMFVFIFCSASDKNEYGRWRYIYHELIRKRINKGFTRRARMIQNYNLKYINNQAIQKHAITNHIEIYSKFFRKIWKSKYFFYWFQSSEAVALSKPAVSKMYKIHDTTQAAHGKTAVVFLHGLAQCIILFFCFSWVESDSQLNRLTNTGVNDKNSERQIWEFVWLVIGLKYAKCGSDTTNYATMKMKKRWLKLWCVWEYKK